MSKKPPKDLRIPIMMTAAEVEAIDDWRFANRIATRAEAIRRLCQTGLGFDARGEEVYRSAELAVEAVSELASYAVGKAEGIASNRQRLLKSLDKALKVTKSNMDLVLDFLVTASSLKINIDDNIVLRFSELYDAVRSHRQREEE